MHNRVVLFATVLLLQPLFAQAQPPKNAPPAAQSTSQARAGNQERKEIKVPAKVLNGYVGVYELTPERTLAITLEDGSLWGQPTGQTKRQLFAESQTKFFLKDAPVEVTFQKEKGKVVGLVMKQGDRPERQLKKVK